ncbi:MAG: tyrosine-type recombinase/integrase [Hyphomonadaceae bacterium]|nr:MAG: phage integrase family [Caulobacteraceae bacterium]MBT9445797.1 tyrosine-type recombinase/integrase [Hyphomonadaceae bacterium]
MAKAKLTKRVVDAFTCPPDAPRAALFDTELTGFHVEAMRSGRKLYRFKWKLNGNQGRETLGEHGVITVDQARTRAISLRGKLFDGETPAATRATAAAARARAITLGELAEKWLEEGRPAAPSKRESSWSTDARKLRNHIVPLLGAKAAGHITRADIEGAQLKITEGKTARDTKTRPRGRSILRGGAGIARSSVMSLSACYSWALDSGIVDDNPCLRVKKTKPRKMERFLTREEAVLLQNTILEMELDAALDPRFADMVRLLLLTGARKSEIVALQWNEVDFERRLIRLPRERSKSGEKYIPLSGTALAILKKRKKLSALRKPMRTEDAVGKAAKDRFVFPSLIGDSHAQGLQKAWERVRRRANLDDVRLHDLRHSFASFAAADGASLFLIGKALGHTQSQTTERYAHLRDDPLHAVAASVERSLLFSSPNSPTGQDEE